MLPRSALIVATLCAGTLVLAAPASPPPSTPVAPPLTQKRPQVPDAEKPAASAERLGRMRVVLRDTLDKLEEARRTKDVVKLNCVNEKLTQVKGLLRVSEQADVTMQEAVARHDSDTSRAEFDKIDIAGTKVDQLRNQAEECIGQLAFQTDQNLSVEVEVPANLPSSDPTLLTVLPPPPSRPPPTSPQR